MDYSIALPPVRSTWRTAALVAAALAAIELVLLIVVGAALLVKPMAREQRAQAAAAKKPAAPPVTKRPQARAPSLPRGRTSVIVLNGNGRSGAAAAEAARVRARGHKVRHVGNAPQMSYGASIVMFRRGYRPEALRLARDLGIARVGPLDGVTTRSLLGAQLAVVVGG